MATVYKVSTKDEVPVLNELANRRRVQWHSSEGAASKARTAMMADYNLKRSEIDLEPIDVPTSKAGLIEWLNDNHSTE